MSDIDPPECPTCYCYVDIDSPLTVSVTKRLAPASVDHYHPDCYDPWRDHVGYGAGSRQ